MTMHRILLPFLFILLSFHSLSAQIAPAEKIDVRLLERFNTETDCEFLVVMQQQADLSAAQQLRTKLEKGAWVFQTLQSLAQSTQGNVMAILETEQAPSQSFWIVNAVWGKASLHVVEQIAQLPEVARIDDNPVIHLQTEPIGSDATEVQERVLAPWGIDKIGAPAVWAMGNTGQNVVIGGQDTGYSWNHRAVKSKYRGWNGSAADHNYNWHDAIHSLLVDATANSCGLDLTAPCDDHSHGTHTMGTMVGAPAADSMIGVAPGAKWIGCRNMEEGDGTPATYMECFQWFIAPTDLTNANPLTSKAPNVINNSWGCPPSEGCDSGNFATMEATVNAVRAAGILVVVSAGNSGSACSTVNDPAAIFTGSFTVGSTTSADAISSFSSRGPVDNYGATPYRKPDIAAPGSLVISCVGWDNNSSTYTYSSSSGTSMAGPHVAGTAALIYSVRPDLKAMGMVGEVEDIIKDSAVPLYTTQGCGGDLSTDLPNNVFGHGRIDALAAVNRAIALPVELLSFAVQDNKGQALLQWETATEENCHFFEIQRSSDGHHWRPVGQVNCLPADQNGGRYAFTDAQPLGGISYYRLRQTDLNGTFLHSRAAAYKGRDQRISIEITPSYSGRSLQINIAGTEAGSDWQLELFSMDGRLIQSAPVSQNQLALALPFLPSGVYVAQLKDRNGLPLSRQRFWWQNR